MLVALYIGMVITITERLTYENHRMLNELLNKAEKIEAIQEAEKYTIITTQPEEQPVIVECDVVILEPDEDLDPLSELQSMSNEVDEEQDVELPNLPSDRKLGTDYRKYNIKGTPHYRMQQLAYSDEQGCRRYGDYYIVGLGSTYANRIGETFEVELSTGKIFRIITGDMKADCDTDASNRYTPCLNYNNEECANIIEFRIDKEAMDAKAYQWGGVDYYENFKGDIVRMTYLGRDTSADWDIYT